jgi:glycerol uptake facilitator-like aquaporin
MTLLKRSGVEALGTAFLLASVVGSGIMAERLSGGNQAIALLANTLATAGALVSLIIALAPISGAHLNPAVSFADALRGGLPWREVPAYWCGQIVGAVIGVAAANTMFGLSVFSVSHRVRSGPSVWLAEYVATFGLLLVIWGCVRARSPMVAVAVAAYIAAAYWFTSSTSFANPAVTLARTLSDSFAGIRPQDTLAFVTAQFLSAISATLVFGWIAPIESTTGDPVLVPHERLNSEA